MIYYDGRSVFTLILRTQGSLLPRAALFGFLASLESLFIQVMANLVPDFQRNLGIGQEDISESQIWAASTTILILLSGFRIKQALDRFWEGTGLLHQMRGEWYDSVSCLMTFSRQADSEHEEAVSDFRHTLIRLMSLCHGSALEEVQGHACDSFDIIDISGLDHKTLAFLKKCRKEYDFNRVEVLLHMIQVLMTQALEDGVINVPAPILSRVYQTLSRGLVNLLNAKKITDTMFPFPIAQLIALLMLVHAILTPILIAALISNKVVCAVVTFIAVFGVFALNLVAAELEIPYGDGENHLPLRRFQKDMNTSLLLFVHEMADHKPHASRVCVKSFEELVGTKKQEATAKIEDRRKTIMEKMAEPPEGFRTKQRRTTIIDMLDASVLAGIRGSFSTDDFSGIKDLKQVDEDGESDGSGHSIWQEHSNSTSSSEDDEAVAAVSTVEEKRPQEAMDNQHSALADKHSSADDARRRGKSVMFAAPGTCSQAPAQPTAKGKHKRGLKVSGPSGSREDPSVDCSGKGGSGGTVPDTLVDALSGEASGTTFDAVSPNAIPDRPAC